MRRALHSYTKHVAFIWRIIAPIFILDGWDILDLPPSRERRDEISAEA